MSIINRRIFFTTAGVLSTSWILGTEGALAAGPKLKKGSRGPAVLDLQNQLNNLGYWCGRADGSFGEATRQAVYALQKTAGLSRDGVVGDKSYQALNNQVKPNHRTSNGIEIDIDKQILIIVENNNVKYILNTSTAAGTRYKSRGTWKRSKTPRGSFSVYRTVKGWQTGELGRMYRPSYFTGGYAIHGSTSIPPYPASHGCARLSVSATDMLYSQGILGKNQIVTVY